MPAREPAIAARAADWLESLGLEVYEEVRVRQGSRVADLVGVGGESLVVVECKLRLGLDLIDQADHWKPYANAVWVAFLDLRRGKAFCRDTPRTRDTALKICRQWGIGVLAMPEDDGKPPKVLVPAVIHEDPRGADMLRDALQPDQRRGVGEARAGTNRGGYATPFKRTAALVTQVVAEHPEGVHVKDVVAEVNQHGGHHYANDKSFCTNIPTQAKAGRVPGVKVRKAQGSHPTVLLPVEVDRVG